MMTANLSYDHDAEIATRHQVPDEKYNGCDIYVIKSKYRWGWYAYVVENAKLRTFRTMVRYSKAVAIERAKCYIDLRGGKS